MPLPSYSVDAEDDGRCNGDGGMGDGGSSHFVDVVGSWSGDGDEGGDGGHPSKLSSTLS